MVYTRRHTLYQLTNPLHFPHEPPGVREPTLGNPALHPSKNTLQGLCPSKGVGHRDVHFCFEFALKWNISILPTHLLPLPTRCRFWSVKNSCSPVTAVHKAALFTTTNTAINQTNHCRLASRKGGVWKNESLSESFGSRWANKVKNKCIL